MDKELLRVIGENVKKYREKANLTQAELAEKIGIGTASVSRIERGEKRMKLETLRAFADALDISVGLLFYQENLGNPTSFFSWELLFMRVPNVRFLKIH